MVIIMAKKKRGKNRFTLREVFGTQFKAVETVLYKTPQLHLNNSENLVVENCKTIVSYTENEICFDMGAQLISVHGDNMVMETLSKNVITVRGRFFNMEFSYCNKNLHSADE